MKKNVKITSPKRTNQFKLSVLAKNTEPNFSNEGNKSIISSNLTMNYNPTELFSGKKVCLIGSGASADKYDIDYTKYDLIIGTNQIFLTKYFYVIDIMYHGLSVYDKIFIKNFESIRNKVTLIIVPAVRKTQIDLLNKMLNFGPLYYNLTIHKKTRDLISNNPLMGLTVMTELIDSGVLELDIYGFDFYFEPYVDGAITLDNHPKIDTRIHDLSLNKEYFLKLLEANSNINWKN